jgi:plastocyanin
VSKRAVLAIIASVALTTGSHSFAEPFFLAFGSTLGMDSGESANTTNSAQNQEEGSLVEMSSAPTNTTDIFSNATRRLFVLQGTVSSPGPDAGPFQIIDILPPRDDGRLYQGIVTFTATDRIFVAPLLRYGVADQVLNQEFGDLFVFPGGPQGTLIAPALIVPDYREGVNSDIPIPRTYSASVPFTGNGLSVGNLEGEPFIITYSLHATVFRPQLTDDVKSAIAPPVEVNGTSVSIVSGSALLEDTAFDPNPVTISAGQNVTWVNNDLDPHTVTSGAFDSEGSGQEFNSGYMGPHRAFSHLFDEAGVFPYYCQIHPNMVGSVIVEPAA